MRVEETSRETCARRPLAAHLKMSSRRFVVNKLPSRPSKIHCKTADEFEILSSFRSDDILARHRRSGWPAMTADAYATPTSVFTERTVAMKKPQLSSTPIVFAISVPSTRILTCPLGILTFCRILQTQPNCEI